jgi:uncharacterized cysteine cluster protein YcgN (CxxCxxCC family)
MPRDPSQIETNTKIGVAPADGEALVEARPFWETKSLEAMTPTEWEGLCDRCGKCCLVKLEDEDSGQIFLTDIGCKLFDAGACACSNYPARRKKVRDCIKLTPVSVRAIGWLPSTCAYRLVAEGRPLEAWHPLVSGSPDTVHEAGISVRGRVGGNEKTVKLEDYPLHIVDWEDGPSE